MGEDDRSESSTAREMEPTICGTHRMGCHIYEIMRYFSRSTTPLPLGLYAQTRYGLKTAELVGTITRIVPKHGSTSPWTVRTDSLRTENGRVGGYNNQNRIETRIHFRLDCTHRPATARLWVERFGSTSPCARSPAMRCVDPPVPEPVMALCGARRMPLSTRRSYASSNPL